MVIRSKIELEAQALHIQKMIMIFIKYILFLKKKIVTIHNFLYNVANLFYQ